MELAHLCTINSSGVQSVLMMIAKKIYGRMKKNCVFISKTLSYGMILSFRELVVSIDLYILCIQKIFQLSGEFLLSTMQKKLKLWFGLSTKKGLAEAQRLTWNDEY